MNNKKVLHFAPRQKNDALFLEPYTLCGQKVDQYYAFSEPDDVTGSMSLFVQYQDEKYLSGKAWVSCTECVKHKDYPLHYLSYLDESE